MVTSAPSAATDLERVGVAAGRDHLLRAEMLGDLHGETARGAGRAVDQHGFAGLRAWRVP